MVLSVMNKAEFEQHLEPCLKALGAMPKAEKFHFKSRVRTIFSRLIRRYGFEKISQLAAEVDQKLVQHIRKVAARKERLAEKMRTEGGADDDGEVLEGTLQPKTTHHLTFEQLMSNDDDAEEGSDTELDDVGAGAGKRGKQSVKANKKKVTAGRSVYLEDDAEVCWAGWRSGEGCRGRGVERAG